jgi:hypothetical protein
MLLYPLMQHADGAYPTSKLETTDTHLFLPGKPENAIEAAYDADGMAGNTEGEVVVDALPGIAVSQYVSAAVEEDPDGFDPDEAPAAVASISHNSPISGHDPEAPAQPTAKQSAVAEDAGSLALGESQPQASDDGENSVADPAATIPAIRPNETPKEPPIAEHDDNLPSEPSVAEKDSTGEVRDKTGDGANLADTTQGEQPAKPVDTVDTTTAVGAVPTERPDQEETKTIEEQEFERPFIVSRDRMKTELAEGIDDSGIDEYLRIHTDQSILPPFLQEQHRQTEHELGQDISFYRWMADHASDDQLASVQQWHDDYLKELDTDPWFIEQVEEMRANYAAGIAEAIAAGDVNPSLAVTADALEAVRIVHSSPFSPLLKTASAYAYSDAKLIKVSPYIRDFTLYHEVAHTAGNGGIFDEGLTDLVALSVYGHRPDEPSTVGVNGYNDQYEMLYIVKQLSEGTIGTYELSEIFAGRHTSDFAKDRAFANRVDAAIGFPVGSMLIMRGRNSLADASMWHRDQGGAEKTAAMHEAVRIQARFISEVLGGMDRSSWNLDEIEARMESDYMRAQYDTITIAHGRLAVELARINAT